MLQESDSFCATFKAKGEWYHISAFSSYLKFVLLIYYVTIKAIHFHDLDGS